MREIGHIEFRSGQTVHFYLGHNGDYVQAQGPNTGLQSFDELGAAIYWSEQKFGPVKRIENSEDFEMDMFSHFHRRTFSPQDVAEIVGQTPASIRAKAASLAETGGERLAYKNAGGWQITTAGLHQIKGWPDGRRKSQ